VARQVVGVVVVLLGTASGGAAAAAQSPDPWSSDQQARDLFQRGRDAFNDGRFEDALHDFRRSYQLSGRPELLFNIGSASDRLRHNQEALDAFEGYLEARPEAPNRREVERRIVVLRHAIARDAALQAELESGQDDSGVLGAWWFWTGVGAVVVGGAILAFVLLRDDPQELMTGTDGSVYTTLVAP
jgi:tetratricopeptide (TPR) repeat protein